MELFIYEHEQVSYVALEGRFDQVAVDNVKERFTKAVTDRGLPTIVDMSAVPFMSSIGIGFLQKNTKELKKAGSKLVLLNPQGLVETVLRNSRMNRIMPIASDLEESLHLLGFEPATVAIDAPQVDATPQPKIAKAIPGAESELKLAIKNDTLELADLYAKVEDFLDAHAAPQRTRYIVNLALEELVVNVIRYAYADFDEHLIDIVLSIADQQCILVIADDGTPFNPVKALAPSLNPELEEEGEEGDQDLEFQVGGLGLKLVIEMVDAMTYARVEEKNRVEVRVQFQDE